MTFNEHSVGVKRHKTLSSSNSRYNCEEGGRGGGLPECFGGGYKMWELLGGWCERGEQVGVPTHCHILTNGSQIGSLLGMFLEAFQKYLFAGYWGRIYIRCGRFLVDGVRGG